MNSITMNSFTWTADEIRQLRYRLGWSRAEMARNLKMDVESFTELEMGQGEISGELRSSLVRILYFADANADRVQRRPIAEVVMKDLGVSQIHDLDVEESIEANSKADKEPSV
jgi:hypothetical protein